MESCDFYAHVMMIPPLTFRENTKAVAHLSVYVTHWAAEKEASSSHVTTECMKNSYTSLDNPSPQYMYAANTPSTRDVPYQRKIYIRGVIVCRQGVKYSSGAYGIDGPIHNQRQT